MDIKLSEISAAMEQLKNGIKLSLLNPTGLPILKALVELYNALTQRGTVAEAWSRSVFMLFFNKNDKSLVKNYRPISLLSHVYELFSRVVTNRLASRLGGIQPPQSAMLLLHCWFVDSFLNMTNNCYQIFMVVIDTDESTHFLRHGANPDKNQTRNKHMNKHKYPFLAGTVSTIVGTNRNFAP
ncbi:unnamed protein product [Euphydryas editha]|uniref:Uncharacterized protein n=1 Tax=Euphydryas editha TaxID=104508 RepID=A0AAU9V8T3_EUPED|nr:unnamed protein product [Euphydryas editha]